ncbi:molybdopterin-dependent oxidoreductase [Desulfitobacterium sp. PCE1]|uniref:molybdopterin-dependent oxidoreductase n=1 Tax=Desulfitobacterium sp. PCE1 TaxID=146907 RepID=UPI0003642026|nr:molybdopterin-dependent oxidoreductase [Desulfitobacterium sp. PCE1]
MVNLFKKITEKQISRRTFLAATAAGTASLALAGCGTALAPVGAEYDAAAINGEGEWIPAACWFNCGYKCYNAALVVDNVVVRQKTDDTEPDSFSKPQLRGCLRGRAQQQQAFGADRLKYPMKRKHWEPLTGGDKSLRGKDEWVRISWDEALDYVAAELKHVKEKYGNSSILMPTWGSNMCDFYNTISAFGGYADVDDTSSVGTYKYGGGMVGIHNGGYGDANDRLDLLNCDTIVLYGCNPAWASAGLPSHNLIHAKEAGAKFIYVGPSYNESANLTDAKWIRVRPGTDTAFLLSVAYVMITEDDPLTNPLLDWDFLNRCTVGFDANHMPADAKLDENFKDYVLGKYDNHPKTPEWASEISGTPVEDIIWFAQEMHKDKKVSILHASAPARCNNADDFPQLLMTIAAMGGHYGKPGHSCGSGQYYCSTNGGPNLIRMGASGAPVIPNSCKEVITAPELWDAVLNGKYNRTGTTWEDFSSLWDPTYMGERDIDIRVIIHSWRNTLQTTQGVGKGIEAHRKVDFVFSCAYSLNISAQYSDIVLPIVTQWEKQSTYTYLTSYNRDMQFFPSRVMEPLFEAKSDQWIAVELGKRLGIDVNQAYPLSEEQQYFNCIAGTTVINKEGTDYETLVTITAEDLAWWEQKYGKVDGKPQQGHIGLRELMEKGIYKVERHEGDNYGAITYEAFVKDPEKNPLTTNSGKFEIYCQTKADIINRMGRSTLKPYPSYVQPLNGYEQSFKDWDKKIKGDYPYQVTNPHYLRRAHTGFDYLPWLREAMPNPVFISAVDAEEKGIKDGDTVLLTNPHGKVLRQASVSQRLMPGYIELPHGTWLELDEKTGIDKSGSDNYLCHPQTSGQGVSGYNTTLANLEKYEGEPLTPDHLWPMRVVIL